MKILTTTSKNIVSEVFYMDEESIRIEIAQQIKLALEDLKNELIQRKEEKHEEEKDSFEEYMQTVKGLAKKEE